MVLAVCVAGPAFLSFSRKLSFYKYPLRLIVSIAFPFFVFVVWDVWATFRGHWGFNPDYIVGFKLINLPIEEILFFIVIPFCALFTWEVVKYYSREKN
jgi:lycopene cyclase domain-containing protein